jgi:ERCC4-related helicase
MTGGTKKDNDGKRGSLWRSKRVIYATPQTIANDILNVSDDCLSCLSWLPRGARGHAAC